MPQLDPQRAATTWIHAALERHEASLVRYAAQRLGGDLERARDIVQEAFLRLCNERGEDVEAHVAEWLHRVVRNLAIDTRRKESRMKELSLEDYARRAERTALPDEALQHGDAVAHVLERLERLPGKQREALRLKFQSGLSYKEIAAVMDETVGNVGWLIHVGLKGLRGRLIGEGAEL
jgi:RNA polymerase sigma-70 factor (ECF subfamily)